MVSKQDVIQMLNEAIELEESFLPELGYLLNQKLLEYQLSFDKQKEAEELLDILKKQSLNHYKLINEAKKRIELSDKNEY